VELDPVHQQASRETDYKQIKPDSNTAPKMDLEKRAANPQSLRPPPETFNERKRLDHCEPCG